MLFQKRKKFISCIAAIATLFIGSTSNAGSLLKLDLASHEVLTNALEIAKSAYEKEYIGDEEVKFIKSTFSPHATLLFLSAADDDSDLKNVNPDNRLSPAQVVLDAAQLAAGKFKTIDVVSEMKIVHLPGNPNGVPSSGIKAGTDYHSVVIEIPAATQALTPLMLELKNSISTVVTRKTANDYPPRVHLTVGYVVGKKTSNLFVVKNLSKEVQFKVDSFILDFPKMEAFQKEVHLNKYKVSRYFHARFMELAKDSPELVEEYRHFENFLHHAVLDGSFEQVQAISEKFPELMNVRDSSKKTPFYYALLRCSPEKVEFMLEKFPEIIHERYSHEHSDIIGRPLMEALIHKDFGDHNWAMQGFDPSKKEFQDENPCKSLIPLLAKKSPTSDLEEALLNGPWDGQYYSGWNKDEKALIENELEMRKNTL